MGKGISSAPLKLEGLEAISDDTIYQAATDGELIALSGESSELFLYVEAATPPTNLVQRLTRPAGEYISATVMIAKNEYFKSEGATNVWWRPLK